jgi:hypothetical protein
MPVENWKNLMLEMLDASAPIFYAGYSNYPIIGHFLGLRWLSKTKIIFISIWVGAVK